MADVGRFDVGPTAVLVLGREQGCDIRLDSGNVSRRHAQITVGPDGFVVEDLSANGTIMPSGELLHREAAWYPFGYYFIVGSFLVTVGEAAAPARPEPPPSARRGRKGPASSRTPEPSARGASAPHPATVRGAQVPGTAMPTTQPAANGAPDLGATSGYPAVNLAATS